MTPRRLYRLPELVEATGLSEDFIRRAIKTTEPEQRLKAKRLSSKRNAPYVVHVDDLDDWFERLTDAS